MKKDLMWTFLIHLSCHMWEDGNTPPTGLYQKISYEENNNTDLKVWDDVVKGVAALGVNTLLIDVGDAVQYETHPEISAPDAWSKDFLKQKLDEIRALGMTPIPKLNFSTCHDAWLKEYGRMVSTPTYYRVCADLIKEVCEVFDYPAYFHLGYDEEYEAFQNNRDIAVVRHEYLWGYDLNFLCNECEKHGARLWMWGAFARLFPETFEKKISRSVLMSSAFYSKMLIPTWKEGEEPYKKEGLNPRDYDTLDKWGFDQIPCGSTWSYAQNLNQTLAYCKDRLNPDRVLGYMDAQWYHTKPGNTFALLSGAERLYYARKEWYPETL